MVDEEETQVVLNEQEQEFFDQHNVHCEVCNQPGKVLCCATCNLVFHLHCACPKLQDEPANDWMCAYCCVEGMGGKKDEKEQRKATQACREIERMKRECVKEHANEDDNDDYEGHEDDEESKDDEDHDDHDGEITSEDDDDDDDNVGAFNNEVEGGGPSAPHSTLIKKLHILN